MTWRTDACRALFAVLALAGTAPAVRADPASLLALQRYDRQAVAIGYRLAMAGGDLCAAKVPLAGFAVHDLSQYSAAEQGDARAAFGFAEAPLVLAVAPASPVAAAGLREGDALLSIDGEPVPRGKPDARNSYARTEALLARIDAAAADGMLALGVRRDGQRLELRAAAPPGCASRFTVRPSRAVGSRADGTYVEIDTGAIDFAGEEEQIAAILAHELAHNILRHRARLNAAGIRRGLLGRYGRSARLVRQTEEEADRLGVYLMDRAGYPPRAIVTFFERYRQSRLPAFLRSATHMGERERIAIVEAEIARLAAMKLAGQSPRPAFMMGDTLPALR